MNKTKTALLVLAYLALIIFAIPAIILMLIGAGVIYAVLMIEKAIVKEIDDYDLSHYWSKWVENGHDVLREFIDKFLNGLELY